MTSVTSDLSNIIGRIYDAAMGSDDWHEVLCRIADWCAVENAAMVTLDPRIDFSNVITPRADPNVVAEYNKHWWALDPTAAATASTAPGTITSLAFTGRRSFYSSEFYNDFWRHSGLGAERLAANLFTDNGAFASFVLQASAQRDNVDGDTTTRFGALLPHLMRALDISRRLYSADIERRNALLMPSIGEASRIVVDAAGRLVLANAGAEHLLSAHPAVTVRSGIVSLNDKHMNDELQSAIRAAAGAGRPGRAATGVMVPAHNGGTRLEIEALPYTGNVANPIGPPGEVLLVLRDPEFEIEQQISRLVSAFGLTRAEARLALEISRGDGRQAAAERCGISINTARTHLIRIFDKTGVKRQAELAKRVLEIGNGGL